MRFGWLAGLCATFLASVAGAEIISARYIDPTTRYAHGVLGDAIEYGTLELELRNGETRRLRLPETRVFEDLAPRLVDIDFDGTSEVVVVESHQARGARLAVYDAGGLIAATPYIGQSFRWLAPVGVGDLDGDGLVEIAYIDRPHLARVLRVWRFDAGMLVPIAKIDGLTNHRIGDDFITGGLRECGQGPELVTVDAGWQRWIGTRLHDGQLISRDLGGYSDSEPAVCSGG